MIPPKAYSCYMLVLKYRYEIYSIRIFAPPNNYRVVIRRA